MPRLPDRFEVLTLFAAQATLALRQAGADIVVCHLGLTTGGAIGSMLDKVKAAAYLATDRPSVLRRVALWALAASAFWLRNAGSAWFLYQKLVFVLGGMLIPLEVFPSGLETVCRYLPFQAMAYAPARSVGAL